MLKKAGEAITGALIKVAAIIALVVVIAFMFGWASNPANKTQRDKTGNSVVEAGFSVTDLFANWVSKTAKEHTPAAPATPTAPKP